ncbi:LOB domain-containing protein 39 [Platanthera guangdongensis]|uniref:LOB domain-containing protein 39 n=1 Tax=Platanthera guangdongensis TaxID=2320717 RepID=A0ABR2LE15_9ASPA
MSCNGCRVLRKGCGESCILRPCLQWIDSSEAQGHATVFVAKFFGRAGLMAFISAVPEFHRPGKLTLIPCFFNQTFLSKHLEFKLISPSALFQSLLFEACGRAINPVSGAVGLLWTRHWHLCQVAVETVLRGGMIGPIKEIVGDDGDGAVSYKLMDSPLVGDLRSPAMCDLELNLTLPAKEMRRRSWTPSLNSNDSITTSDDELCLDREKRLLNLFV